MDPEGTLSRIDWSAPWFEPWRDRGERVAAHRASGLPLHDALNMEAGAPVRFASEGDLPPGVPYESHIFGSGRCPTRDNLHDFFNGLAWLAFPQAKRRLNELQAAELDAGARAVRGPVRDAITVFDENGAVLHAPDELWHALLGRDWLRAFVELRPLWQQARVVLFGHALLEKMVAPRKDITAHVWRSNAPPASQDADGWLAGEFDAPRLAAKPFTPLPLLGIPGWWGENADLSFYDDRLVFRGAGRRDGTTGQPETSRP